MRKKIEREILILYFCWSNFLPSTVFSRIILACCYHVCGSQISLEERVHLHHLGDWILACLSRIFLFTCLIIQPIGWREGYRLKSKENFFLFSHLGPWCDPTNRSEQTATGYQVHFLGVCFFCFFFKFRLPYWRERRVRKNKKSCTCLDACSRHVGH